MIIYYTNMFLTIKWVFDVNIITFLIILIQLMIC